MDDNKLLLKQIEDKRSQIDLAMQDKIKGIAYGDYKQGIKSLEQVFEQRKKCAELMLSVYSPSNAKDFLDLCNAEIRDILFL